jgi:hypothetical protein
MTDPSDTTLKPVADFVDSESRARFPVVEVPTELLDWLPPVEQAKQEQFGDKGDDEDSSDRAKLMIQSTFSQYSALLERDGYCALTDLREKLETRRQAEATNERVLQYRLNELEPLLKFFEDHVNKRSKDTPIREIIDSPVDFRRTLPGLHTVTRTGSGEPPDGQDSGNEDYQGEISPSVKGYDAPEYEPPTVEFSESTTLSEIKNNIESKCARCRSGVRAAKKLRKLIRFRLRLLQRFVWTYEMAGTVPEDPTVQRIPELVQRRPAHLEHVVRVLDLIAPMHEDGQPEGGEWPSQPELIQEAEDHFTDGEFSAAPGSVVKQAAQLISDVYYIRYEEFRDDFYELLLQNEEEIRKWADEMDDVEV